MSFLVHDTRTSTVAVVVVVVSGVVTGVVYTIVLCIHCLLALLTQIMVLGVR